MLMDGWTPWWSGGGGKGVGPRSACGTGVTESRDGKTEGCLVRDERRRRRGRNGKVSSHYQSMNRWQAGSCSWL